MAAATSDVRIVRAEGFVNSYPVAAATTLFRGEMITKDGGGFAKSLTDGDKFEGHAYHQVANTTAAGFGTAGDRRVEVIRGESGKYQLEVTLANSSDLLVGAYVYAVDDSLLTLAPMATVVGRLVQHVSANLAIVEFDTGLSRENMGAGVHGLFMPFRQMPLVDGDIWTITDVEVGAGSNTEIIENVVGKPYHAGLLLTSAANESDGHSIQFLGETFKLTDNTPVIFGARIKVSEATQSKWFIGLAIVDVAILGAVTDRVGIEKLDGVTDVKAMVEKDGTQTLSAAIHTLVDDTFVTVGFIWGGSTATAVIPYIDGVAQTALADTNTTDDEELRPSLEFLNGDGNARTTNISFIDSYQIL